MACVTAVAVSARSEWTCVPLQVGDEGAGHFVKMVHNGIEYGDMQLICEAYHLMKDVLGMDHDEMAKVSRAGSFCMHVYIHKHRYMYVCILTIMCLS